MKKIVSALLLLTHILYLHAQEVGTLHDNQKSDSLDVMPAINTDRPTQSAAPFTVPARTLQVETGFLFEKTKSPDIESGNWQLGTTLLRYGVWEGYEVRLSSYYGMTDGNFGEGKTDTTEQGFGPLTAGFKVHIIEEKGLRPEIAILAEMTLRHVGSLTYRPTFSYPTAKIAASNTLAKGLTLLYNAGFGYNGENADGFFIYSIMLAYSITPWLAVFGEGYGTFDNGDLPNHRIDGGFTFLIRNNLQLDLAGGTGFDSTVDKSFIATGLSWRIPR